MLDYDNDSHEGAICPHCGYLNQACDSEGELYDEGRSTYFCGECDVEFLVDCFSTWLWSTKAKPEGSDGRE